MRSLQSFITFLSVGLLLAACSSTRSAVAPSGSPSIAYRVAVPDLASETFDVSATVKDIVQDTMTFYFPIWAPGAYDLVYFGRYVHDFTATAADGRPLQVIRPD